MISAFDRHAVLPHAFRPLFLAVPLAILVLGNLLRHLESIGFLVPPGLGWRLGMGALILLIALIGGRIIPAFTRNWLMKRTVSRMPTGRGLIDIAAETALGVALMLWAVRPDSRVGGGLLVVSAALNAYRLKQWAGGATCKEPLLCVLHVGYGWVVIGVALLGLSVLDAGVPVASAIHALSVGAIGTMILAVMPRVTLGHTGRVLTANRATVVIFALITIAATVRVGASWMPDAMRMLIAVSGVSWTTAFALWMIVYAPMLLRSSPPRG